MYIKKLIHVVLFIFLNYAAFGEGNRCIFFFAKSLDTLQTVSERFYMTVPTNPIIGIFENLEKLYSVVSLIYNYVNFSDFKEYPYNNTLSELTYLCSPDLLRNASADKSGRKKIFDVTCWNICRLLGVVYLEDRKSDNFAHAVQTEKRDVSVSDGQSVVDNISDGIAICNKGLLKLIKVVSENNNIKINLYFEDEKWNESIVFIDFYIDLNNVYGAGATSLLDGINGFLTMESGWEYALRIYKDKAVLYKYSSDGASIVSDLPVNSASVLIPQKYIRGNPVNWGYQAVIVSEVDGKKFITDFLNQSAKAKEVVLFEKPFQLSAVRLRE